MSVTVPLGIAVGRIGDVINGEHYEVLIGAFAFAIVWSARHRLRVQPRWPGS
jgi:prolipoprotein diacylglyceryltransferase